MDQDSTTQLKFQMASLETHLLAPCCQPYGGQPPALPGPVSWSGLGPSSFGIASPSVNHDGTPSTSPLYCPGALPGPSHSHNSVAPMSTSSRPCPSLCKQQQSSAFQPIHHHPPQPDAVQNPNTLGCSFHPGVGQEISRSGPEASDAQGPQVGSLEDSGDGINPDLIPNPAAEEDKMWWESQLFRTDLRGQVPPLTTTHFTVEDQGIASPRFVRCTTYTFPCSQEMAQLSHLPLAAIVKPLATLPEEEVPVQLVDHGEGGPIRCERCTAVMCPLMQFLDNGHSFQCPFCDAVSRVPLHYFHPIDYSGKRADRPARAELSCGSYEFLLSEGECKHNQGQSRVGFIFMIDVSYNAVRSGLLGLICAELKKVVQHLPREPGAEESAVRVGFITYDRVLHFYNVKESLIQPQMVVATDVADVTVPLLDGFLVNPKESSVLINSLLDKIPLLFADSLEGDVLFGPVVQAGLEALQTAGCWGKLFLFHTSLPTARAPGELRKRNDNTNKEQTLFQPQSSYYQTLAEQCVQQGCCVDLFLFPTQYVDVASLGLLTLRTGGDLYYYSNFRVDRDAEQFQFDFQRDVQKVIGFNAKMKVHTRKGIRVANYLGSLHMENRSEVKLAAIDSDKAVVVEFKHDGKLSQEVGVHIQFELLYHTVSGHRRLRIHNASLNCSSQLIETFRSSQAETLLNYFAKTAYRAVLDQGTKRVQDQLVTHLTRMLASYRKHCAHSAPTRGQLVMPQFLKVLPLYLNCLRKSKVLLPGPGVSIDDRAYLRQLVMSMGIAETNVLFYPRLLPIHGLNENQVTVPREVRCTARTLSPEGFYLLEDGLNLFLWIGMLAPAEWIQNVFGAPSFNAVDCGAGSLPVLDNPSSRQIRGVIHAVRKQRARFLKLLVVKQADGTEGQFRQLLVEDKSPSGGASYPDFLHHVHLSIQQSLR
ncbi:protein transport protein Sec24C-like isoform X2 [Scyliorhinus canicula]|uniref:protein transport protein Sec24C-like isoform X2 n=1 Tax=Scyliorhinus canicula TaxID=7830 RepID=UPI0018F398BF|nr:protein transport protein Sec24C-like isoform X2 [Scyliorhinus canicula]